MHLKYTLNITNAHNIFFLLNDLLNELLAGLQKAMKKNSHTYKIAICDRCLDDVIRQATNAANVDLTFLLLYGMD